MDKVFVIIKEDVGYAANNHTLVGFVSEEEEAREMVSNLNANTPIEYNASYYYVELSNIELI